MDKFFRLIGAILLCLLAGGIGSFFTISAIPTWYADLAKPSFNPPNWIFGPVWTTLYTLMGISLYLVWQAKSKHKQLAYKYFFAQLILNTLWSIIFFGWKQIGLALAEIIVLWLTILLTIIYFFKVSKRAAWLLAPYLAWVTFATVLTAAIFMLNK